MNNVTLSLLIIFFLIFLIASITHFIFKNKYFNKIKQLKHEEKKKRSKIQFQETKLKWINFNLKDRKYLKMVPWYIKYIKFISLGSAIFAIAGVIVTLMNYFDKN